jgi:light-regulated signal transduction histidine kinase (bacteriophytochrome)
LSTAKETFGTRYTVVRKKKENVCISSKPWFSNDCKIARKQYRKLKRRCNIDPSIETKEDMKRAEKEYKKMDANIKMHRKEMSRKIKNLRSNNSKEHWNILRQGTNKKQPNISIDSLFEFF